MGKKRDGTRKRRGAAGRQARVVGGGVVRTRAAVTARRAAAKRRETVASASAEEGSLVGRGGGDDGEGGCYMRLRSRRLYFTTAAVVSPERPLGDPEAEARSPRAVELLGDSVEAAMVGTGNVSRSASAASSAERTQRSGGAAQAGEDRDEESSVGDSGYGCERREATPSSRPPGDESDAESNHSEEQKRRHGGRSSTTSAAAFHAPARTRSIRMAPATAAEIEEFLAAAEKTEAERFAAKYNFDVVRGVPLDGAGRFEWTAVGSG